MSDTEFCLQDGGEKQLAYVDMERYYVTVTLGIGE